MGTLDIGEFSGSDYDRVFDQDRLTGQIKRIYEFMSDGKWRTLSEIEESTGDAQASISAQLRNLRKEGFGSHTIHKRRRGDRTDGLFEYSLDLPPEDPRHQLQQHVVELACNSTLKGSTYVLATGFGKSKVAIDIIKRKKPKKVIILVNSTDLRDYSWKDEFEFFNMGWFFDKFVTVQTYQSAHDGP